MIAHLPQHANTQVEASLAGKTDCLQASLLARQRTRLKKTTEHQATTATTNRVEKSVQLSWTASNYSPSSFSQAQSIWS